MPTDDGKPKIDLFPPETLNEIAAPNPPLIRATLDKFGGDLPAARQLDVQAFAQTANSCGETASATILKAAGVPLALGDVDMQVAGFPGTSGQSGQELRRRGLTVVSGPG